MEQDVLRKKRSTPRRRAGAVAMAALIAAVAIFALINKNMRPALASLAEARITSIATNAMNDAISECMEGGGYGALVQAHENGDSVYMLEADAQRMNALASDCSNAAQERITALGEQGLSLPVGTISGITFLSGKGPRMHVSFTPVGSVSSKFNSELVSSGINQSLYRVNIELTSSVRLIMPGISRSISVSAEAAIAESLIIGDVPEVYTNVESTEDMLNLVPTEAPDN